MKSALRLLLVLLAVIVLACALSACEIPAGIDGFTIIFNTTTAATTTADPVMTTTVPTVTTDPAVTPAVTVTTTVAPSASAEPKQIKKVKVAPTIDGVIDEAYLESASFSTAYQPTRNGAPDPMAMVDPYSSAAMMEILRGYMVTGATATSAKFYFLWGVEEGIPYIYVAIEVNDPTKYERTEVYTSYPDPWINDCLELHYHFGGSTAPSMYNQHSPYPVYNGVVRDSKTGSNLVAVGTDGYLTPTAVEAQKSIYFNQIECAVSGRDTAGDTTYVIEYKITAKTESYIGKPTVNGNFQRQEGDDLRAGDFVYFTYQLNDLTGLPNGYTTTAQYDAKIATFGGAPKHQNKFTYAVPESSPWFAFENTIAAYMYSAGNSRVAYLNAAGAAPMTLQLSNDTVEPPTPIEVFMGSSYIYNAAPVPDPTILSGSIPNTAYVRFYYYELGEDGTVIEKLGQNAPINCGSYSVTAVPFWKSPSMIGPLPDPVTRYFHIVPALLSDSIEGLGVIATTPADPYEISFSGSGTVYDPIADDALFVGILPYGITRVATIEKLSSANQATAGTPTAVDGKITSVDGAGYYSVTITYSEVGDADNYFDEEDFAHNILIHVISE